MRLNEGGDVLSNRIEGADYEVFKRKIFKKTGLDLDAYKHNQMERRLRSSMERTTARDFTEYYRLLEDDETLMREFLDRMTINISALFRNPEQFQVLQAKIIPELTARSPNLRVWSAGCSWGQEAYSLAICLKETAPLGEHRVLATDIDEQALGNAKKGVFSSADAEGVGKFRTIRWFSRDGEDLVAKDVIRGMIEVRRLNLLGDPYPRNMDLIVCRNVAIYFTDDTKSKLYAQFFDSLKPGGYLLVGGVERVNGHAKLGYLNPYPFFYRKPVD